MNLTLPKFRLPMTAIVMGTIAGQATASQRAAPDDHVIEWVEISIHMPDGRVIKMKEPRYPSRSRVLITTGKLPPFKPVGSSSEPGSDIQSADEPAGDSASLTVELEPQTIDTTATDGQNAAAQSGTPAQESEEPASGFASQETESVAQVAVESNAAVRQFTKSN